MHRRETVWITVMENSSGALSKRFTIVVLTHSYEELKTVIEEYIVYYNEYRIKESLGWLSPAQYRRKHLTA